MHKQMLLATKFKIIGNNDLFRILQGYVKSLEKVLISDIVLRSGDYTRFRHYYHLVPQ